MTSCARHHFWSLATKGIKVFPQRLDVLSGVFIDGLACLLRLGDDAVFDVSDIHHVRHLEAFEFQITTEDVGRDCRAKVTYVAIFPNGWTAVIELNFALLHGAKLLDTTGKCVANSKHIGQ